MMSINDFLRRRGILLLILLTSLGQFANADPITILPIGDSLTNQKSGTTPSRGSYRPYLWQSIDNYLSALSSTVTVDFVGSSANQASTPSGASESMIGYNSSNPNSINPAWDTQSFASAGLATGSFTGTAITDEINANLGGTAPDLALVLLGTNDLFWGNIGGSNPLFTGSTTLGNIQDIVSQFPSTTEVLLAPIPPVAYRPADPIFDRNFNWTETTRISPYDNTTNLKLDYVKWDSTLNKYVSAEGSANNSDPTANNKPDGNGGFEDATSNDVIQVLNDILKDYADADAMDNVTWVDPFVSGTLANYPFENDVVTAPMDPTRYDDTDTPSDNVNSDLIDGLHLNSDGDQKYAAAFYKGVLDTVLSDAVAAAVPEPSSFAFMGLVALFGATVRRYRRRRA